MKTLLIMRHAKSSWSNTYLSDHERPLNERGQADAPRMGELLKKRNLVPDLIISSTAKRAKQTAEGVIATSGYENHLELTRDFFHAAPEAYIEKLREVDNHYQTVMVVGHNPGVSDLLQLLTDDYEVLTTGNIAHINFEIANWADLDDDSSGRLIDLWRPKEL